MEQYRGSVRTTSLRKSQGNWWWLLAAETLGTKQRSSRRHLPIRAPRAISS